MTVGRCHNCTDKPAFTWPLGLMTQAEATCPGCGFPLSRTNRTVRGGLRTLDNTTLLTLLKRAQTIAETRVAIAHIRFHGLAGAEREAVEVAARIRCVEDRIAEAQPEAFALAVAS